MPRTRSVLRHVTILVAPLVALGLLLLAGSSPRAEAEPTGGDDIAILIEGRRGADGRLPIVLYSQQAGPVELAIQRVGRPELLMDEDLARGETLRWLSPEQTGLRARRADRRRANQYKRLELGPLQRRRVVLSQAGRRQVTHLEVPGPGLYLVHGQRGRAQVTATALVTDLALIVKRGPHKALVWAVDRKLGTPVAGVRLFVDRGLGEEKRPRITTDASGLAEIRGRMAPEIRILGVHGDDLAFGDDRYYPAEVESHRVYTFGHQPAYRPGERVELKGLVRAYESGRHRIDPRVTSAHVSILDAAASTVAESEVAVDANTGSYTYGFDLGRAARTGTWTIVTRIGAQLHQSPLRVDAYRKPAFEVRVRPHKRRALIGSEVKATISAQFLDGGALPGAQVTWQWMYNRVDPELFPDDELIAAFFGTERDAFKPQQLARGKGELDARGQLVVAMDVPSDLLDGYLSVRATVTGRDRIAVSGSGGIGIAAAPVTVAVRTDRHVYGEEDVAPVHVRVAQSLGGSAAEREGMLTLSRDIVRDGRKTERWEQQIPFTTDAEGEARLEVPLTGEARYTIQVVVPRTPQEPAGPPATAEVGIWATGDEPTIGLSPGHLQVIADRDAYEPGQDAVLLVRLPRPGQPVLATVEGARLMSHEVLDPKRGSHRYSIRIEAAHAPNLYVGFACMHEGRLLQETAMLRVPPRHALLTTRITPDETTLEPGGSTGVTIEVRDLNGVTVPGVDLSFAVVDDALYTLFRDPGTLLSRFFHSPRRNNVRTGAIASHTSLARAAVLFVRKNDVPAPSAAAPPPRSPGSPATGGAAAGRGGAGGEQPAADPAAGPTPEPRDSAMPEEEVMEESEADELADDAADRGEERPRNRYVPTTGKKAKFGQAGARVQKTREDFRSAIYWAAALETNEDGRVRIESIQFADSLTRWRLTARGLDADTRIASATARVQTRRLVSARLTTPRFLVEGDRALVPLLVRNQSEQADVGLSLEADVRIGTGDVQPMLRSVSTVTRGEPYVTDLRIHAQTVAPHSLEVRVAGDVGRDAERREIPVLRAGIRRTTGTSLVTRDGAATGTLEIPAAAAADSLEATLSIEPGHVHVVLAALPYLLDYPHGCTEQTLNRFVPLLDVLAAVKALQVPLAGRLREGDAMLAAGIDRLSELARQDGAFGWWPSGNRSPGMTALVARGLSRARELLPDDQRLASLHDSSVRWLARWLAQARKRGRRGGADLPTYASVLVALAQAGKLPADTLQIVLDSPEAYDADPLTKSLLLRCAIRVRDAELVRQVATDLIDDALDQTGAGTRHWQRTATQSTTITRWQDDPIETTAEVLDALLLSGHASDTLLAAGVQWLIARREAGDRWRSTRDTGAAVRFLANYMKKTGDIGTGRTVTLHSGERVLAQVTLTVDDLFGEGTRVRLPGDLLKPGTTVPLSLRTDRGRASAGIALRYFEPGTAIQRTQNGLTVRRTWFEIRFVENDGKITPERHPVTETVASGSLLECVITVETPETRDYVMVTSPHAGGMEPARGMRGLGLDLEAPEARRERRDERTHFFFSRLAAGKTVMRHYLRATHVGNFVVLPAEAELMYFPVTRANTPVQALEITGPDRSLATPRKEEK